MEYGVFSHFIFFINIQDLVFSYLVIGGLREGTDDGGTRGRHLRL